MSHPSTTPQPLSDPVPKKRTIARALAPTANVDHTGEEQSPKLYLDQLNNIYFAQTLKELRTELGNSHVNKMYVDKTDGRAVHVGYVIGKYWLTAYIPMEKPA